MWKGLFVCFLLAAAGQDLKRKQVDVIIYLIFGVTAAALGGFRWLALGEGYGLMNHAAGVLLGAALLGAGRISGGVGTGDGCFFMVSGLMLGFWENLALLCCSTLLCGIFCLGYYVWGLVKKEENVGRRTVPFLPFAVLPGLCLALPVLGSRIVG